MGDAYSGWKCRRTWLKWVCQALALTGLGVPAKDGRRDWKTSKHLPMIIKNSGFDRSKAEIGTSH